LRLVRLPPAVAGGVSGGGSFGVVLPLEFAGGAPDGVVLPFEFEFPEFEFEFPEFEFEFPEFEFEFPEFEFEFGFPEFGGLGFFLEKGLVLVLDSLAILSAKLSAGGLGGLTELTFSNIVFKLSSLSVSFASSVSFLFFLS
jgi:hypothetical protein